MRKQVYISADYSETDGDKDGEYSGVRPHKEKINISKELINKTR